VRRSLYEGIERLSSSFVPQGTANVIYRCYTASLHVLTISYSPSILGSFGEMKVNWADLPETVRLELLNGIERNSSSFSSQEIANIILGY
jgi:hypothetical protein